MRSRKQLDSLSLVVKIKQAHSRARNTADAFVLLLLGTHYHFLRVHILLGRKDWFDCPAMFAGAHSNLKMSLYSRSSEQLKVVCKQFQFY
jgi:hypothetical protein